MGKEKDSSEIKIFDLFGKQKNSTFWAYGSNFRGGVNLAVCDFDADGKDEIVTGAEWERSACRGFSL